MRASCSQRRRDPSRHPAPFFLIAAYASGGWRAVARQGAAAAAVFAVTNLPFAIWHPADWLAGVLTPIGEPMFPRGAGLVFLGTNGGLPLLAPLAYVGMEAVAMAFCLVIAWRTRHTSPELGIALALVPLFFAQRSLFSYFFLIPLYAFAGLVRLPLGDVSPQEARAAGALTLFALPAPLRVIARGERAA